MEGGGQTDESSKTQESNSQNSQDLGDTKCAHVSEIDVDDLVHPKNYVAQIADKQAKCRDCSAVCTRRLCCCFRGAAEPVMILFTVVLILVEGYTMLVGFCVMILRGILAAQIIVGIICGYVVFMALFHYFIAAFIGKIKRTRGIDLPCTGLPPLAAKYYAQLTNPGDDTSLIDRVSEKTETCMKCGRLRPLRTHHCSSCKVCSVRFDHHCPWVGCVAMHNYFHFFAFILFSTIGCLMSGILGVLTVSFSFGSENFGYDSSSTFDVATLALSGLGTLIGLGMTFGAGSMLILHIKLVRHNETTIEHYDNEDAKKKLRQKGDMSNPNIYDLGSPKRNLQETFGTWYGALWCIPYIYKNKKDAFYWESKVNRLGKDKKDSVSEIYEQMVDDKQFMSKLTRLDGPPGVRSYIGNEREEDESDDGIVVVGGERKR